jgi:hypothetical protein
MTVVVSLLRGVNVGGHAKIKMDALRELYTTLGLSSAQTLLQSGNVVFKAKASELPRLPCRATGKSLSLRAASLSPTFPTVSAPRGWRAA